MKKILLIPLLFASKISFAQSKISGTITYFHSDYQGNKADVGSIIYVSDSSNDKIDFNAIDSLLRVNIYITFTTNRKIWKTKEARKKRILAWKIRHLNLFLPMRKIMESTRKKVIIASMPGQLYLRILL